MQIIVPRGLEKSQDFSGFLKKGVQEMNAQELKHKARLAEWKEKVALCRSSGMSVRGWCREQGIAYKTYYYWEKEVLSEAGRQAVALNGVENRFVEVPALPESISVSEREPVLVAKLRIKSGELEIYAGAETAMLEMLVRVLRDAE